MTGGQLKLFLGVAARDGYTLRSVLDGVSTHVRFAVVCWTGERRTTVFGPWDTWGDLPFIVDHYGAARLFDFKVYESPESCITAELHVRFID